MAEWISVRERLPETNEQVEGDDFLFYYSDKVLVYRPNFKEIEFAYFVLEGIDEFWTTLEFDKIDGVVYWMPLPEPPKEAPDEN